ncbi:hypothetical protein CDAR_307161 [Caerostris darwini]|uniref:Uncharacterized protein n=1 Tax=Caerostris darwini TaxID=1538125 RepID=A0AAV4P015_9ARAC|nr:hypothetical protein CDAR_307161 [Caerostris darwini]
MVGYLGGHAFRLTEVNSAVGPTFLSLTIKCVGLSLFLDSFFLPFFPLLKGPFIKDVTLLFNKSTLWHRRLGKARFRCRFAAVLTENGVESVGGSFLKISHQSMVF